MKRIRKFLLTCMNCVLLIICYEYITYKSKSPVIHSDSHIRLHNQKQSPGRPSNSQQDITLVTAYWNIGTFLKPWTSVDRFHTTQVYLQWAKVFRYIMNPLVVYTDSREFSDLIHILRNTTSHRTQVHLVNRNVSIAFRNINRTKEIYSTPGYPKHQPSTTIPEYTCAVHSKFEFTTLVATENVFHTTLFAWLDVGYFRDRKSTKQFKLVEPKGFNSSMIAMNELEKRRDYSSEMIIKRAMTWVGAGVFLGRGDLMVKFGAQFQRAVEYLYSKHLMGAEEPILYAVFSKDAYEHIKPDVQIQTYVANGDWFFLGKHMVQELNTTFVP